MPDTSRIRSAIAHATVAKYGRAGVTILGYEAFNFEFTEFAHLETVRVIPYGNDLTYVTAAGRKLPYTRTDFEADRERLISKLETLLKQAENDSQKA